MKKLLIFLSLTAASLTAYPKQSSWYVLEKIRTSSSVFFFDMNSVVRDGDQVELWTNSLSDEQHRDEDGATSVVMKQKFHCVERTYQILATMKYGPNQTFIGMNKEPDTPSKVPAGSVVEGILDVVCATGFPSNALNNDYSLVKGNNLETYLSKSKRSTNNKNGDQDSSKNLSLKNFDDRASMLAAARSGDPIAQYMYGRALYTPDGNRSEARIWMQRARPFYQRKAEEGIAEFQFELANLLWNLNGRPNNEVRDWYKRAAAQGHAGAIKALKEL